MTGGNKGNFNSDAVSMYLRVGIEQMSKNIVQIKGDPSIRRFVFEQKRVNNFFDEYSAALMVTLEKLMRFHGVFHVMVHYSRGQVTLWHRDNPFSYQVVMAEELLAEGFLDEYKLKPYSATAQISADEIPVVLASCKSLRMQDERLYLRTGSLNIMNGVVGLNFSCDGTHYMNYKQFLNSPLYEVA